MKPYRIVLACLFAGFAFFANRHQALATPCAVPYNASNGISNGQPAQAAQINSNFSALQACENNVDNTNIGTAGIFPSQLIPTTGTQATFGGGQEYTFPNGAQTNLGGTLYGIPFDANSTTSDLTTHIEGGTLTTATFSAGYACAPLTNFKSPFSATPHLGALMGSGTFGPYLNLYIQTKSASQFQICAVTLNSQNGGTVTFDWTAMP